MAILRYFDSKAYATIIALRLHDLKVTVEDLSQLKQLPLATITFLTSDLEFSRRNSNLST